MVIGHPQKGSHEKNASHRFRQVCVVVALATASVVISHTASADEAALHAEIADLRAQVAEMKAQLKELAARGQGTATLPATSTATAPSAPTAELTARLERL